MAKFIVVTCTWEDAIDKAKAFFTASYTWYTLLQICLKSKLLQDEE